MNPNASQLSNAVQRPMTVDEPQRGMLDLAIDTAGNISGRAGELAERLDRVADRMLGGENPAAPAGQVQALANGKMTELGWAFQAGIDQLERIAYAVDRLERL